MDNIYVTLPPELVAIKFPGYFFHVVEQQLYSLKSGVLKPLHRHNGNPWNDYHPGYTISHKGVKIYMREDWLISKTKQPQLTTVPYYVPDVQQQNSDRTRTYHSKRTKQNRKTVQRSTNWDNHTS